MVASQIARATIRYVDIAVYFRRDELQLIVEVKSTTGGGPNWAKQMRRNIITHLLLELGYVRDESESCERIIEWSEQGRIVLALPAFCLGEPYESWVRRTTQRRELSARLAQEIGELSRSRPYVDALEDARDVTRTLIQSGEEEKQRLDGVINRVVDTATIIPVDRDTVKAAHRLQGERSLSPQDSIVYAAVLAGIAAAADEPKCFLTKNSKDVANPDVYDDLRAYNCKLLTRFDSRS